MSRKFKWKQCKSIIAFLLCIVMALGMIPATSLKVKADGVVAILVDAGNGNPGTQIGDEAGYNSLQAAFTATEGFNSYTGVVLQKDVTIDSDLTLDQNINLFLNGHTLTIESGKTLTATNKSIDVMNYTGAGDENGAIVCDGTIYGSVETFSDDVDLTVSGGGISSLNAYDGSVTITGGHFTYAQIFDGKLDITGGEFDEFCQEGGRTDISGGEFGSAYSMNNMGSPTLNITGSPSFENLRFEYYNGCIDDNTPTTETVIVKGSPFIKNFSVLIQAFGNDFNLDGNWGSLTINGGYFGNDPSNSYYSGFDYDSENMIDCTDEEKARVTINVNEGNIEEYSNQTDWIEDHATYPWRIVDPSYSSTVAVTGVTLNKSSLSLAVGGSETLTATVEPENTTDKTVTWSSNKEAIATVDNTGKITAVSAGTATITATAGDKSATCEVTVTAPSEECQHPNLYKVAAKAATCTETGNIEYWKCNDCGKLFSDQNGSTEITEADTVTDKIAHTPGAAVKDNVAAATCETAGSYEEVVKCSVCGEEISRTMKTTTALGHDYKEVAGSAKAATCTSAGKESDKKCSRCNAIVEGKVIAALGHKWGEWKTTKNPTETEEGIEERVCGNDATHKETRSIAKLAAKPVTDSTTTTTTTPAAPATAGTTVTDTTSSATYTVTSEAATGSAPTVEYAGTTGAANQVAVTIPDTVTVSGVEYKVTSVAKDAFKNDKSLTTVTIGNNVETIEEGAFENCKNLTKVTIAASVTTIGDSAFEGCTSLTKITIPANVTKVGVSAFEGCKKLKSATIGKNVTEIGTKAFANCTALTSVTLPAKVTKIGSQVFKGSKKLKTLTIKSKKLTAKSLAKNAFKGVSDKVTIKVPKGKKKAYTTLFRKKGLSKKVKIK